MKIVTLLIGILLITTTSCKKLEDMNGFYEITTVNGNDYSAHDINMTINVSDEGNKISGKSACNRYFGDFKVLENDLIEMGMLGATKMYCRDVAAIEKEYLDALNQVHSVKTTSTGLDLLNNNGDVIIVAVLSKEKE